MSTPVSTDRAWRNRIVGEGEQPASQLVNWLLRTPGECGPIRRPCDRSRRA
jgi:hypothetical protein